MLWFSNNNMAGSFGKRDVLDFTLLSSVHFLERIVGLRDSRPLSSDSNSPSYLVIWAHNAAVQWGLLFQYWVHLQLFMGQSRSGANVLSKIGKVEETRATSIVLWLAVLRLYPASFRLDVSWWIFFFATPVWRNDKRARAVVGALHQPDAPTRSKYDAITEVSNHKDT